MQFFQIIWSSFSFSSCLQIKWAGHSTGSWWLLRGRGRGSGQLGEDDDIVRTGQKSAGGISLALTPISAVAVMVTGCIYDHVFVGSLGMSHVRCRQLGSKSCDLRCRARCITFFDVTMWRCMWPDTRRKATRILFDTCTQRGKVRNSFTCTLCTVIMRRWHAHCQPHVCTGSASRVMPGSWQCGQWKDRDKWTGTQVTVSTWLARLSVVLHTFKFSWGFYFMKSWKKAGFAKYSWF